MKKIKYILAAITILFGLKGYSQVPDSIAVDTTVVEVPAVEEVSIPEDDGMKPVRNPFESCLLIDNYTTKQIPKGGMEFWIHHRFGKFGNGATDLWGIYAPSNIRLGFNYGVTKNLYVGFGTEKNNKMQEFIWKYNILTQTRNNKIPVSVSYLGNFVISAKSNDYFGNPDKYKFMHRYSYLTELMVSRKFGERITLLASSYLTHFNMTDTFSSHNRIGLTIGGRVKVVDNISLIFETDRSLEFFPVYDWHVAAGTQFEPKPNYAIGFEKGTGTHAFQLFLASYENILLQQNLNFNNNDFFAGDMLVGFNITVRF